MSFLWLATRFQPHDSFWGGCYHTHLPGQKAERASEGGMSPPSLARFKPMRNRRDISFLLPGRWSDSHRWQRKQTFTCILLLSSPVSRKIVKICREEQRWGPGPQHGHNVCGTWAQLSVLFCPTAWAELPFFAGTGWALGWQGAQAWPWLDRAGEGGRGSRAWQLRSWSPVRVCGSTSLPPFPHL